MTCYYAQFEFEPQSLDWLHFCTGVTVVKKLQRRMTPRRASGTEATRIGLQISVTMMTGLLCAYFAVPACVRIGLHFLMFTAVVIPVSASLAAFAIDLLFMCSGRTPFARAAKAIAVSAYPVVLGLPPCLHVH